MSFENCIMCMAYGHAIKIKDLVFISSLGLKERAKAVLQGLFCCFVFHICTTILEFHLIRIFENENENENYGLLYCHLLKLYECYHFC